MSSRVRTSKDLQVDVMSWTRNATIEFRGIPNQSTTTGIQLRAEVIGGFCVPTTNMRSVSHHHLLDGLAFPYGHPPGIDSYSDIRP